MQVLWGGVVRGIGRVHISCFIFEELGKSRDLKKSEGIDYKRELERMS